MNIKVGQIWRIVGLSEKSVVEVTSITGNAVFFEYDGEETRIKDWLTVSEFLEFHEFVRNKESVPRSDAINHPEHYISHPSGIECIEGGDLVNNPPHYKSDPSGIECIEISENWSFCLGNALKYLWRNGKKDGEPSIKDLEKAKWYIEREIDRQKRINNK